MRVMNDFMRVIKKLVLLFAIGVLLVSWLGTAHSGRQPDGINQILQIPDVVARVNGSDIPARHIKFQFMRALKNARVPMTSTQKDKIIRKVIDKEIVRLKVKIQDFEARVFAVKKKIDNKNFVTRAPKAIVENERKKFFNYENNYKKLLKNLNSLSS